MRNYNQQSHDTIRRTATLNRSRSQNHYYIQANQFQKRYQNSLINAYRLNNSRKCPPCCNASDDRQYENNMTFCENEKENFKKNGNQLSEYYETSYFNNQGQHETLANLQKSKRYLEELVEKSNFNFRIYKERAESQVQTLQKLLQQKNTQIQQLTVQIIRLKKISLQTSPSGINMSYMKQDQAPLIELQNKEQTIKELQRKVNRLKQENSYFRQDIEIKNKQIEQQKSKFKLKEENDIIIKRQLQRQNSQLKQAKRIIVQKITWLQKSRQQLQKNRGQRQKESQRLKDRVSKLQTELEVTRIRLIQAKQEGDNAMGRNSQKIRTIQNQFRVLRQRSKEKDMQIESLLSKVSCIQSELDFFKDKFTNLLLEIEREERQSATIFQHAVSLKEEGLKFYEATERLRQSEIIDLQSQPRSSRLNGNNWFDPVENRLTESIAYVKGGFGRDIYSPSAKKVNKYEPPYMMESEHDFTQKFPSLNMSISPIRLKD